MTLNTMLGLMSQGFNGWADASAKRARGARSRKSAVVHMLDHGQSNWLVNLPDATSCTAWIDDDDPRVGRGQADSVKPDNH